MFLEASAYSSGQLFGQLFVVVLIAAGILHFWKTGPAKEELAPKPAPPRPLSIYGQQVEPVPTAPPTATAPVASGGRPSWAAPAIWSLAAVVCVVLIATHKDPDELSSAYKSEFVRGCTAASGGREAACGCLLDQLIAKGYDTKPKLQTILEQTGDAAVARSPNSLSPDVVAAIQTCAPRQ